MKAIALSTTVIYSGLSGLADAFAPRLCPSTESGSLASRVPGASTQRYRQSATFVRLNAATGTTKPSLKPSWKSPRQTKPFRAETTPKTDDLAEQTQSSTSSVTGVESSHSKSFERPTWRTPKTDAAPKPSAVSAAAVATQPSPSLEPPDTLVQEMRQADTSNVNLPREDKPATPSPILMPLSSAPVFDGIDISLQQVKDTLIPMTKTIRDNIAEGTIGERGEQWTLVQVALLVCIVLGTVPLVGDLLMIVAGPGLVILGSGVAVAGVIGLGKSLSPWPTPVKENVLQISGIFGLVRHPCYVGKSVTPTPSVVASV